jgi:uncharacterized protein with ParB-like and HNH nuclease domain
MRDYPINTFMMWEVKTEKIKKDYKFYKFLGSYCQRFGEENPFIKTTASFKDFNAIIDGQQRLTSLYIGLCGTYAYKQPRVWWPNTKDDRILPARKLYLDLQQPTESEDDDALMHYNFKFLTQEQYEASMSDENNPHHWFCMHEVLNLPKRDNQDDILLKVVMPELARCNLTDNKFARKTLLKLYNAIRSQNIIHYFKETSQDIDHVLDVFIRTNSGGTKLDFADLLMSIAVVHWDGNFKQELDDLTKHIRQNLDMGFYIERDWILKACLMLTDTDVRFKVQNFKAEQVQKIQQEWQDFKACIKATFLLVRRLGINPQSLTSKNAVMPICYYLYKKQADGQALFRNINKPDRLNDERSKISQWFYMVLLKGVFGGQADSILTSMREVLKSNLSAGVFPLEVIIERYKATNKDLRFDDEYIESMLDIQHGEGRCRSLLHLLFPEMDLSRVYHIDHLHPKAEFNVKKLKKQKFLKDNEEVLAFYSDQAHWNSIANLHLLDESQNRSKQDQVLKDWLEKEKDVHHLSASDFLVSGVSLEFSAFKEFYDTRRAALKKRLISLVFMSRPVEEEQVAEDSDEEVVEEAE